jgi:hypothetical protein
MGIEKVAQRSISANQYDLLKALTLAALFEQPKEPFDRNIDDAILSLFAGSAMNDVSHPVHCGTDDVAV